MYSWWIIFSGYDPSRYDCFHIFALLFSMGHVSSAENWSAIKWRKCFSVQILKKNGFFARPSFFLPPWICLANVVLLSSLFKPSQQSMSLDKNFESRARGLMCYGTFFARLEEKDIIRAPLPTYAGHQRKNLDLNQSQQNNRKRVCQEKKIRLEGELICSFSFENEIHFEPLCVQFCSRLFPQ